MKSGGNEGVSGKAGRVMSPTSYRAAPPRTEWCRDNLLHSTGSVNKGANAPAQYAHEAQGDWDLLWDQAGSLGRRLRQKIRQANPDECWLWTGATYQSGYGRIRLGGRSVGCGVAHRAVFRILKGDPGTLQVCHKCDNPPCCNPAHLFLGTAADNATDRNIKGRARGPWGKTPTAKVLEAKRMIAEGCRVPKIAAALNISTAVVAMIRDGRRHAYVRAD